MSSSLNTDATVTFNDAEITVSEDDADVEVCLSIFNIPDEGINSACMIEVTLNFTGITTSTSVHLAIWCGLSLCPAVLRN